MLISGRGTNLRALLDAAEAPGYPAEVRLVISNRPSAAGLELARQRGVEAVAMPVSQFGGDTTLRDGAIRDRLLAAAVGLVVCAGYDRMLTRPLLDAYADAILNVHPSLLPAFGGGMRAVEEALEAGVKVTGCTVQLLEPGEPDGGPILLQAPVAVEEGDDAETLRWRIHEQEWRLLPEAVAIIAEGRWRREGRRLRVLPAAPAAASARGRAALRPTEGGPMALRALLGPYDKTGLVELARGLRDCGAELIATDGTRRTLAAAGIEARAVAELTGLPEMLDGRVKTLHPAIQAGILARRELAAHLEQLERHGFAPIDIVAVSLYPFRETVARGADRDTVVENIDIGGPTMIRAAAKNAASVAVLVSPSQYGEVLGELRRGGAVSEATRRRLAAEAFAHTAAYDAAVAAYLAADAGEGMPAELTVGGPKLHDLRYGENPHQRGAVYAVPGPPGGVAHARRLQGPELSFTNWLDVDAARRLTAEFAQPAACIIKHTNPCGFAVGSELAEAYGRAFECDPRAAFGGIVGLNRPLDLATAERLAPTFLEAVVAPRVEADAAARLERKARLRVLAVETGASGPELDVRSVEGGLLVQTADRVSLDRTAMRVATRRAPTEDEWEQLLIAWRVCRYVKSNAIVIVRDGAAVGVGAGQMSRVESVELAVRRAGERARGAVAASDAFFPMTDGLETAAASGVVAMIQPGGSRADPEVIEAADRAGMAMVLTGERHFRH